MITATINKYFGSAIQGMSSVSAVKFTSGGRIHQLVFANDRAAFASSAELTARKTLLGASWSAHALASMEQGIATAPRVDAIPDITTMPFGIRLMTGDIVGDAHTSLFQGPFEAEAMPRDSYAALAASFETDAVFQKHLKNTLDVPTVWDAGDLHLSDDMAKRLSRLFGRPVLKVSAETANALGPYFGRGLTAIYVANATAARNDANWTNAIIYSSHGSESVLPNAPLGCYVMRGEEQIMGISLTWINIYHYQTGVPFLQKWGMRLSGLAFSGGVAQWAPNSVRARLINGCVGYSTASMLVVDGAPVQWSYASKTCSRYDNAPLTTPFYASTPMGATWAGSSAYSALTSAVTALSWNEAHDSLQPNVPALPRRYYAFAVGRPPGVNGFYLKGASATVDAATRNVLLQNGVFGGAIENAALVSLMRTYIDDAAADPANRRQAVAAKEKLEQAPDGYVGFCSYPLPVSYSTNEIESTSLYVTYDTAALEVNDPVKAPRFYDITAADGTKLSTFRNNANAAGATPVLITVADASVPPGSAFVSALAMPNSYQVQIEKVAAAGGGHTWDCSAQRGTTTVQLTVTEAVMLISAGATAVYLNTTASEVDLLVTVSANERALALSMATSDLNTLDLRDIFPNAIPDVTVLSADAQARAKFVMFGQKMTSLRALVLATLAYAAV